jgi:flavin-dependent dehydrogenase
MTSDTVSNRAKKVKIAGAGPAGLTAAICLAKAGYAVDLYEARATVGARFVGDFQVLENGSGACDPLELLKKIGILPNFFVHPIYTATLFDYRLREKTVSSRSPFSYLIQRGRRSDFDQRVSLDEGLRDQALAAGVSIHYQTRVNPEEVDIVATGPAAADGLAKEMTFRTSHPDVVWVLFDTKYAPGGYAYLFIFEGIATLGCAITRDLSKINQYFDATLSRFSEIGSFTIEEPKVGYSFMDFSLKSSATYNQRLYIGEAGGFQDYLFGLGLRYALVTGYLSAMSLIRSEQGEATSYDVLWRKEFGVSQEMSLVNRLLYEWGGNRGLSYFVWQAARSDFKDYLTAWQRSSFWKQCVVPFVKWGWQRPRSGVLLQQEGKGCRHLLPDHWCRSVSARKRAV